MIALLGLKPWEPQESVPRLTPPGFGARVGEAIAVPTVGPAVAVAEAAVSPGRATLVSRTGAQPREDDGGKRRKLAVGPALAVAVAAPGEETKPAAPAPSPVSPQPEAPLATVPAPELASAPMPSATPEAGTPGGPVRAGTPGLPGGEEECEGDEYVLTIALPEGEEPAEEGLEETPDERPVTILLERIDADGNVVDQLELEGVLGDARSLVLQLTSEGGCVEVQVDEGDAAGASAGAPEAG